MVDFERDDDKPLSGEERRRLKGRNATGKVPKELAALDDRVPPSKKLRFVDRGAVRRRKTPPTLDGYAPPWMGVSFAPKRVSMPPPPVVTRGGERLDPLVIH